MSPELQRALENYKEDGRSVSPYFLKMKGYLDSLERLGCPILKELGKDKKKPLGEKGNDKGNNNLAYALKPKIPPLPKRDNLAKESICHHCKEVGTLKKQEVETRSFKSVPGEWRMRAAVEAIASFDLVLPSGLIIVLDNFLLITVATKEPDVEVVKTSHEALQSSRQST
nr:hypothetical protein [Tanacetum cinerariifolium]